MRPTSLIPALTIVFQYLSPERARGLPHDTRKSDVWSLGVTLFEILRGRTPFEHAEPDGKTETFSTKAVRYFQQCFHALFTL